MIISEMSNAEETTILEIWCGIGEIASFIAQKTNAQVFGTDICVPFIEEASEKLKFPNLTFDVLNFNHPDTLKGKKFDYIIENGILRHFYCRLDEALKNILLLLTEGWKLIFLELNISNTYCYLIFTYPYFRKKDNLEPDEMAFTKNFIQEKLKKAGYKSSNADYKDFLLPVIPNLLIKPVIILRDIAEMLPLITKCLNLFLLSELNSFRISTKKIQDKNAAKKNIH